MADLLGQISNPQMADIAGALDYRQKKLMEDEQRRKEIQFNQLAGQALSSGLKPDSVMAKLAMSEPAKYVMIAKTLGLDPANGAEGASLMDDVSAIYQHSVTGAEDGLNFVNGLIETRNKLGLDTSKLQSLVALGNKNPNAFLNSISALHNTFNPSKPIELSRGSVLVKDGKVIASNVQQDQVRPSDGTADMQNWNQYQNLLKTNPAAAEQFGRAAGFSTTEGVKLSGLAEKTIVDSTDAATQAASSASKYKALASKLESAALSSGIKGTWGEFIKEQTGNQDELTALRKEALAISNSEAIKSLPPGPATDRDIEIAKAPFPTEKADPKYVANWLGAVSRLREKEAEFNYFKADFVSKHGTVRTKDGESLASAWKKSQIDAAKQTQTEEQKPQLDSSQQKETAAQRLARLRANAD